MATPARDRRRDQLLNLGLELFASRPYDEVVIEDLAAAAGISKGLLYHYFGSKRSFYAACVRATVDTLVDQLDLRDLEDPTTAVVVGIGRYMDFLAAHRSTYQALIQGGLGAEPEVQAVLEEARAAVTDLILERLAADRGHPVLRNTVRSWLGAVEAGSLDWLIHGSPDRDTAIRLQAAALAGRVLALHRQLPELELLPGIEAAARGYLLG